MTKYNQETEEKMLLHFSQLSEKNKRHCAALEAERLGYGDQKYISGLFQISPFRIRMGLQELKNPVLLSDVPPGKERRIGGGRKKRNQ